MASVLARRIPSESEEVPLSPLRVVTLVMRICPSNLQVALAALQQLSKAFHILLQRWNLVARVLSIAYNRYDAGIVGFG